LQRPSRADIDALPEHLVGEIIARELVVSPRLRPRHAFVAGGLTAELVGRFQRGLNGPGGWIILPETSAIDLVPDWVCEILSPSTKRLDPLRKLPFYARVGVAWTRLVDPDDQTIEVYQRAGDHWALVGTYGELEPTAMAPFDAVPIDLKALFDAP